jgi:hypothetical protein
VLAVGSACAHGRSVQSSRLESVQVGDAVVHLKYGPDDAEAAQQVKGALQRAAPAAARWGSLSEPVLITIHPTHQALETASHLEGQPWVLAWARHATVDLQSPRTWPGRGGSDEEVAQILTHELTHCVMYQSVASGGGWLGRAIPLWFREGLASVTAGQKHHRLRPEDVWRFYGNGSGGGDGLGSAAEGAGAGLRQDPLTEPRELYRSSPDLVYATAHWAFAFLLDRHGEHRIRRLLARVGDGAGFEEAFREVMGTPVQDFEADFRHLAAAQAGRG